MPGTTPDEFPGPRVEEEVQLETQASDPTTEGAMRYVGGAFKLKDSTGVFDPRSGGGGITEAQHEALDSMVHWINETNHQEIVRSEGKVTNVINWTDSGKTTKIRELAVTRSAGKVSQLDFIQYDGGGTESQRMTGVITRDSGKISTIAWTKT